MLSQKNLVDYKIIFDQMISIMSSLNMSQVTNNISIAGNDPEYMVRASGISQVIIMVEIIMNWHHHNHHHQYCNHHHHDHNQDVTIGVLPMYHIYGLNVTLAGGLYMGCKHIVLPSFK